MRSSDSGRFVSTITKGDIFGKLTAIRDTGSRRWGYSVWECTCKCGRQTERTAQQLRKALNTHCGCSPKKSGRPSTTGNAALNVLWHHYRNSAHKRGYSFELSRDDAFRLFKSRCAYCNIAPTKVYRPNQGYRAEELVNGIDRVNNKLGYKPENCVPCCSICNTAKSTLSREYFLEWVRQVYQHSHSQ